jgi:hypothetical protein
MNSSELFRLMTPADPALALGSLIHQFMSELTALIEKDREVAKSFLPVVASQFEYADVLTQWLNQAIPETDASSRNNLYINTSVLRDMAGHRIVAFEYAGFCYQGNPIRRYYPNPQPGISLLIGTLNQGSFKTPVVQELGLLGPFYVGITPEPSEDPPICDIPLMYIPDALYGLQTAEAEGCLRKVDELNGYLDSMPDTQRTQFIEAIGQLFGGLPKKGVTVEQVLDPAWRNGLSYSIQRVQDAARSVSSCRWSGNRA